MKTIINSSKSSIFTFVKRFIYSFQVLMVGIAIPVLFVIGISNGPHKNSEEPVVNEAIYSNQLPQNQVVQLNIAGI